MRSLLAFMVFLSFGLPFGLIAEAKKGKQASSCRHQLEAPYVPNYIQPSDMVIAGDRIYMQPKKISEDKVEAFWQDENINKFYFSNFSIMGNADFDPSDIFSFANELAAGWNNEFDENEYVLDLPIFNKETDEFIGTIYASFITETPEFMDIGIALVEGARGSGLARDSLKHFLRYIKANFPRVAHVEAHIRPENIASQNLFKQFQFIDSSRTTRTGKVIFIKRL